jgi:RNA polymerase sigma factor (sigma-70 family)
VGVLYFSSDDPLDDVIAAAQTETADDTAAMAEILRRFEGAVVNIAQSVTADRSLQQDAAQGARLGLVKAVRAHSLSTPGFPSYARRFMKGAALRMLASMSTNEALLDPRDLGREDQTPDDAPANMAFEVIDLVKTLTPEQQAVTVAYYVADRRLHDLAIDLGISKPAVSQRLSTIHRALRPVVEKALAA